MSVVSELSMLELYAERGELLPEREPLSTIGNVAKIAQVGVSVDHVSHSEDTDIEKPIDQTQDVQVNQDFNVDLQDDQDNGD